MSEVILSLSSLSVLWKRASSFCAPEAVAVPQTAFLAAAGHRGSDTAAGGGRICPQGAALFLSGSACSPVLHEGALTPDLRLDNHAVREYGVRNPFVHLLAPCFLLHISFVSIPCPH